MPSTDFMVFSSLLFLFRFLPVMLITYFAFPVRFRNVVLFLGSLIFYGWGEPIYISLLLFSTLVDYSHGLMIEWFRKQENEKAAGRTLLSSVVINLGLLGFFKYAVPMFSINPALPIGISFYTFQTMSYTIDIYRKDAKAQHNLIAFGAYVSMFPQLIAGPIVRYHTIAEELNQRKESYSEFAAGIRYFVIGLGKKVLLANQIGALWNEISQVPQAEHSVLMAWMGIFAFGMQIYFDFSGYSDMAIGLGRMMGFHFPENFCYPYTAKSITDFWRRWHISLGTWLKEYVYIPLGGNQNGKWNQVRNILLVWLLTGIWHGAGWNYLLWGVYFGVLLLAEKFLLHSILEKFPSWMRGTYAMVLVFLGWVLFAHENMTEGMHYLTELLGGRGIALVNTRTWYLLVTNMILIGMTLFGATPIPKCLYRQYQKSLFLDVILVLFVFFLVIAYLVDATYNPFLYFRF